MFPATRRVGEIHVGEAAGRDLAAVEARLNSWMDARWNLVRARDDKTGDVRGAMIAFLVVYRSQDMDQI